METRIAREESSLRRDIECLRVELLASVLDAPVAVDLPPTAPSSESIAPPDYANQRLSEMTKSYLRAAGTLREWKADELRRQTDACGLLVELTDDTKLGHLRREGMRTLMHAICGLPDRRDIVRRRAKSPWLASAHCC